MKVKSKSKANLKKEVSNKRADNDGVNVSVNRDKKKAFKLKQREERRRSKILI